ncbi:NAD(P)-dependent oxidoreductase [Amycolatopsis antarctica]|uniref:NAD(P)-dependent oxidoreductase n=1 Tax=Amycolatopsis antarctica TaxID=1854586 RepID=A0A263D1W4_9PSEU|nr:SDR family oxidoreductase [Amycolatopsis antarctica]OZM72199.1 NAD(P)-dependent oxidoreductase [Amycolatopsis antarctica]
MRCLVTGATGYIGGRLVPQLLAEGHEVRCLARDPAKLRDVPWANHVEVVRGDVRDPESMAAATAGIEVVYYLVHSLEKQSFAGLDRQAALITAEAARAAGVGRIVYLGGLRPRDDEPLSEHLASRAEVGEIFLRSGVPTAVLRAAVILGSGSASFEMLRYLTERLPVMVVPRWVHNRVQPIAVRDVLRYLVGCAELPEATNRTFDIGGPDVLTYLDMMRRYAAVAGLPPRRMLPVPALTPRLSSHWVNIVTPVPRAIAGPLIDSLVHEVVCGENDIEKYVAPPETGLLGYETAVRYALAKVRDAQVETRWSGASVANAPADPLPSDPAWSGGSVYTDDREASCTADVELLWRVIEGVGGSNGWYSFPLAWAVRGWMDRLAGGVGLRRGRRDQQRLQLGEAVDWWRVEELDRGTLLRLRAEMKVPGGAWLEMRAEARPGGGSVYRQRAVFLPKGLTGHAYWWSVAPFHGIVFGGMVRNIVHSAERAAD